MKPTTRFASEAENIYDEVKGRMITEIENAIKKREFDMVELMNPYEYSYDIDEFVLQEEIYDEANPSRNKPRITMDMIFNIVFENKPRDYKLEIIAIIYSPNAHALYAIPRNILDKANEYYSRICQEGNYIEQYVNEIKNLFSNIKWLITKKGTIIYFDVLLHRNSQGQISHSTNIGYKCYDNPCSHTNTISNQYDTNLCYMCLIKSEMSKSVIPRSIYNAINGQWILKDDNVVFHKHISDFMKYDTEYRGKSPKLPFISDLLEYVCTSRPLVSDRFAIETLSTKTHHEVEVLKEEQEHFKAERELFAKRVAKFEEDERQREALFDAERKAINKKLEILKERQAKLSKYSAVIDCEHILNRFKTLLANIDSDGLDTLAQAEIRKIEMMLYADVPTVTATATAPALATARLPAPDILNTLIPKKDEPRMKK